MTSLDDLVTFARLEVEANDIEPWAAVITWLYQGGHLTAEEAAWLLKLYNTYDNLGSAWRVFTAWPDPRQPIPPAVRAAAPTYPISQERRNLRGGVRLLRHMESYRAHIDPGAQIPWLRHGLVGDEPGANFLPLLAHLRQVWGTGRLSAFEWAEFTAKVLALPVDAVDGRLWESSGPRRSLQRLYGNPTPTPAWLNARAVECRAMLAAAGVPLSWWDFETVICDFNVMVEGRYYPGQHIAMIREEIEGLTGDPREVLREALRAVVPTPWCDVPPVISKPARRHYRDTGVILTAETLGGVT